MHENRHQKCIYYFCTLARCLVLSQTIDLVKAFNIEINRHYIRIVNLNLGTYKEKSFIISGTGDVLEPEGDVIGIGSGGNYALGYHPIPCTSIVGEPSRCAVHYARPVVVDSAAD